MNDHSSAPAASSVFESEILRVFEVLEKWRRELKRSGQASTDELPPFDARAAMTSVIYYFAGVTAAYLMPNLERSSFGDSTFHLWFWPVHAVIALLIAMAVVQLCRTFGFHTRRFWRSLHREFSRPDNYPFTPLIRTAQQDLGAKGILDSFSTQIIDTANSRLQLEESELRDRIGIMVGNSTFVALLTLLVPIWAAWQIVQAKTNAFTMLIFVGSLLAIVASVYGVKLRLSLFELSRCRSLLSLELARRKHLTEAAHGS